MKTATLAKDSNGRRLIKLKFPPNKKDIANMKTLTIRNYHSSIDCWSIPLTKENLKKVMEWDFIIDKRLEAFLLNDIDEKYIVPGLKGTLRSFQNIGVQFIEQHNGCCLIADEQGLGKTIEAIGYLQLHPEMRPALIVMPASVKINWAREIKNWMNPVPHIQILNGQTPYEILGNIVIVNYDILTYWTKELVKQEFKIMILDEAHFIKNSSTKRISAIRKIKKNIPHRIALTGTPIENCPYELFNAINFVDPTIFPDQWAYIWDYCDPKKDEWGWKFNGAANTAELHQKLISTIMLRRLKKDVLPELPEKIRTIVPIELENKKEYSKAEADYKSFVKANLVNGHIDSKAFLNAKARTEGLKQFAVQGKLNGVVKWIEDYLETEGKLVIVTTHTFVINLLIKSFPKIAVKLDGSVIGAKRQEAIDSFQNDLNTKLFIVNLKAGGIGITLTAASNMLVVELGWNPKQMDQMEDRIHRIGQTKGVNIYYAIAINTIEEKIAELLDAKRKIVDAITDGIETENESLLIELMKEYL
jgi:SWI/SNF-related matrix-associated actin-dependent regulator 1 of chromatin subfamily A